ncbi:DUF3310 domain-containing protein [Cohnella sp. GCM10012308]|uniref:DUF3310 domain-containing protein n=1 Tax=Cohnella sp. GCM10012308 TaxID=3317329 RepID=UPI003608E9CE
MSQQQEHDPVKNPTHYTVGGIQAIDYMFAKLSAEEFKGLCRGNALKYLSRQGHKAGGAEDLRKAQEYLGWLVNVTEGRHFRDAKV